MPTRNRIRFPIIDSPIFWQLHYRDRQQNFKEKNVDICVVWNIAFWYNFRSILLMRLQLRKGCICVWECVLVYLWRCHWVTHVKISMLTLEVTWHDSHVLFTPLSLLFVQHHHLLYFTIRNIYRKTFCIMRIIFHIPRKNVDMYLK